MLVVNSTETGTIGAVKCRQRARNFDELFRNQFVLSKTPRLIPASWNRHELAGWTLGHGDALPVIEILDTGGQVSGFLLGIVWDGEGQLVSEAPKLNAAAGSDDFPRVFEEFAVRLGGRFIALLLTTRAARLYGDPVSDLSWVYDPVQRNVGSSLSVLAAHPIQPNPEFHTKSLLTGWTVASFQQTIDRRIMRGLANHYLDLTTFENHRFWPGSDTIVEPDEAGIDRSCERIAAKLALILKSLTSAFACVLPVTGGHDSRVLLSCGSGFLSDFTEFSGYRFHNASRIDTRMGKELVTGLGQKFQTYFKVPTQAAQIRDFRLKTGWACTRKELAALNILEQYPRDAVILRGCILDMLRANQWRSDRIGRPPHVRYGLRRLRLREGGSDEAFARWSPKYEAWMETLPGAAKTRVYDLAFLEHWLPHTLGAYYTGFQRNFFLNPFNDRELIGLTVGISPEVRKNETAVRKVIRAASSELPVDAFH